MHLLAAQAGQIQQDGEAINLGQTPGDIAFLSAADSELAMLAAAVDRAGADNVRLASTMRLSHNMSVDLWIEQTAQHAKLIVARLLGGRAYWTYGTDQLVALARRKGVQLALLPGDANPDPALREASTVAGEAWDSLHALLVAGGGDNVDAALRLMQALAQGDDTPASRPEPFAPQGLYWPGKGAMDIDAFAVNLANAADRPVVPILFYRAVLEGAGTDPVTGLVAALETKGLGPVPVFVSSLKQRSGVDFVKQVFDRFPPEVILNLTGFALGLDGLGDDDNPFAGTDAPVIQLVQAGRPEALWQADPQGLSPRDLAMQIVLPELDGRIGGLLIGHKSEAQWHTATQCPLSAYAPHEPGIKAAAELAANWVRLHQTPAAEKRTAIVLANYPIRDGRLANGVGYDAPQSTVEILKLMQAAGHALEGLPENGNALIDALQAGPTNTEPARGASPAVLPLERYRELLATLPDAITKAVATRWGDPADDPFCREDDFHLPALMFGKACVMLQPARGYDRDLEAAYHDPDLVPPHAYLAAYLWLRHEFGANALLHNGKHGTLEWLPGKATALDSADYPLALWGTLPHFYPFIVNDPGEGTQAKRRTGAVILDHLVPPLTRAETYGPLKNLEALADEYFAASGMDQRRLKDLRKRIFDLSRDTGLDKDAGIEGRDDDEALGQIDTFLCDLKEAQIRDGLHIFGQSPEGRFARDLTIAMARIPRGDRLQDASLIRALADDLALGFDPLDARHGEAWTGPIPENLSAHGPAVLRSTGDMVEALEALAAALVDGEAIAEVDWSATRPVLAEIETAIRPKLEACGPSERHALIEGLSGRFIAPGSSGAPTRGRLGVLPTGRNFYSVDNRAVPTATAWELGKKSAENLVKRHFQETGTWLSSMVLSVWGTANMRTGGDDIAQALALIGAKPVWDPGSFRVSGYEIIPLPKLDRPRVDVTLRVSGFFRDAFPAQIDLFDRAIRAIGALDEPEDFNPIAHRMRADALEMMGEGAEEAEAAERAGYRVFGSKPGSYGAGLQGLIDTGNWTDISDIAEAFMNWGQYAYGAKAKGVPERARLASRLKAAEAIVHNQDNREHDLLDSDDYYQFEGGLVATAEALNGTRPRAYHNDHSRPERPVTRTLEEEIGFVMRSRVVNPKWIHGVKRHGYKGAFEIIATVDYMFAFAATTGAVKTHHFDLAFEAFVMDDETRDFIKANNRFGYDELIDKFNEARTRGFWTPKRNSAYAFLEGEAQ
ncbi:cobaltochelatase subunit CobN [Cucumibacter marinus]|uniref:cobaltochelatase subunit CobN n=1 Tax=Cucumibacter marinus TaxID=1121252 RepID=UPI000428CDC1|nr:cobaltochelatase subunit CobN [Cucumibacter marinus]